MIWKNSDVFLFAMVQLVGLKVALSSRWRWSGQADMHWPKKVHQQVQLSGEPGSLGNICDEIKDSQRGEDEVLCQRSDIECPNDCGCLVLAVVCLHANLSFALDRYPHVLLDISVLFKHENDISQQIWWNFVSDNGWCKYDLHLWASWCKTTYSVGCWVK